MFASYALAIGLGLAVIGLFFEMANHFRWSKRRKGWGGIIITAGTMGVVLLLAERINHILMATACACTVLALSIRVSQTAIQEKETELIEGQSHEEVESVEVVEVAVEQGELVEAVEVAAVIEQDELVEAVEELAATVAHDEIVEAVEVAAVAEQEEFVETVEVATVVEQEELVEAVEVVAVIEPEGLVEVADVATIAEQEALPEEVHTVEEQVEPVAEVSAEWLNMQIANGFAAKSEGLFAQALQSFEAAASHCTDAELTEMLRDEIADCYFSMTLTGGLKVLLAS